jgi:hypothetical protein
MKELEGVECRSIGGFLELYCVCPALLPIG